MNRVPVRILCGPTRHRIPCPHPKYPTQISRDPVNFSIVNSVYFFCVAVHEHQPKHERSVHNMLNLAMRLLDTSRQRGRTMTSIKAKEQMDIPLDDVWDKLKGKYKLVEIKKRYNTFWTPKI